MLAKLKTLVCISWQCFLFCWLFHGDGFSMAMPNEN